jgi:methyl-accepting chemotaxis protein
VKLTIGRKLMLLSGINAALVLALGAAAYWGVSKMSVRTDMMMNREAKLLEYADNVKIYTLELRRAEKDIFLNIENPETMDKYVGTFKEQQGNLSNAIEKTKTVAAGAEDQKRLKEIEADRASYEAGMSSVLGRIKEGTIKTPAEGNKAIAEYKDAIHRLEKDAGELAVEAVSEVAKIVPEIESLERSTLWWTGMFTLAAVALGFGFSLLLGRTISRPLKQVAERLQDIAQGEGDLTRRLEVTSKDEIGDVAHWFNTFIDKLEGIIRAIGKNTQGLAGSAEELTAVSEQMSSNSEETAAQANGVSAASEQVSKSVQTVAAGAEEMSASIKEISKNTSDAARVAKEAVVVAEQTNQTIAKLGDSSAEIGKVIKVITSIAEQTNLLALNATIEAARAGEAGKGFAVVANEVKELAKQTGQATEDISQKIGAIQHDTQGAVTAIQQIGGIINQVNDIANTIATAVEEQSVTTNEMSRNVTEAARGSNEIVENITGVAQAAQSTASGATQTQAAAQELARTASELQSLVNQFKYGKEEAKARSLTRVEESSPQGPALKPRPVYRPHGATLHTL